MAVKAINLAKRVTHQLSSDEAIGTDNATTFVLGSIDSRAMAVIKDRAITLPMSALDGGEGANATMNMNQVNFEIVVYGLKGWTNFQDPQDLSQIVYQARKEILGKSEYLVAPREIVAMLDTDDIQELAEAIMSINQLSDTERKNSEG